jgi:hypothetical protein
MSIMTGQKNTATGADRSDNIKSELNFSSKLIKSFLLNVTFDQ